MGIIKSNMNSLRKIMSKFNMTIDKAMEIIDIPVNEKPMYREKNFSYAVKIKTLWKLQHPFIEFTILTKKRDIFA